MQLLLVSSIFMSMATSLFCIYVMATSFFYIDIDIDKLTERPVVLLNAIFYLDLFLILFTICQTKKKT